MPHCKTVKHYEDLFAVRRDYELRADGKRIGVTETLQVTDGNGSSGEQTNVIDWEYDALGRLVDEVLDTELQTYEQIKGVRTLCFTSKSPAPLICLCFTSKSPDPCDLFNIQKKLRVTCRVELMKVAALAFADAVPDAASLSERLRQNAPEND